MANACVRRLGGSRKDFQIHLLDGVGVAYRLFLAWRMRMLPAAGQPIAAETHRDSPLTLFFGGLSVTMGNPRVMVFYVALLPTMLDLERISALGYIESVCTTLGVLSLVYRVYIGPAAQARLLFTSTKVRIVNRGSAAAMTAAAGWVATR
jgi:threonine/homoserine/homoserine lactone efflux protein